MSVLLFFDEPTSGLDYKHMKEVANVLKQVRDAGITLYVITHDLELLLDCCIRVLQRESHQTGRGDREKDSELGSRAEEKHNRLLQAIPNNVSDVYFFAAGDFARHDNFPFGCHHLTSDT